MHSARPALSLEDLAKAVAEHSGKIDPDTQVGRTELLKIAGDILDDPEGNNALLSLICRPKGQSAEPHPAWAYPGQIQYLETVDIIDEHDRLFDDIDHLRATDMLGRPLNLKN